jgi:hypothetical protein
MDRKQLTKLITFGGVSIVFIISVIIIIVLISRSKVKKEKFNNSSDEQSCISRGNMYDSRTKNCIRLARTVEPMTSLYAPKLMSYTSVPSMISSPKLMSSTSVPSINKLMSSVTRSEQAPLINKLPKLMFSYAARLSPFEQLSQTEKQQLKNLIDGLKLSPADYLKLKTAINGLRFESFISKKIDLINVINRLKISSADKRKLMKIINVIKPLKSASASATSPPLMPIPMKLSPISNSTKYASIMKSKPRKISILGSKRMYPTIYDAEIIKTEQIIDDLKNKIKIEFKKQQELTIKRREYTRKEITNKIKELSSKKKEYDEKIKLMKEYCANSGSKYYESKDKLGKVMRACL